MLAPKIKRFLKYSSVGTATFALDLILLYLLIDIFAVGYLLATGVAFLIAVSINYFVSRRFVFGGTLRSVGGGYFNFIAIALAGLGMVVGGMYALVEVFSVHYIFSRMLIAVLTGFWNYLMNLYVNFKVAGKQVL